MNEADETTYATSGSASAESGVGADSTPSSDTVPGPVSDATDVKSIPKKTEDSIDKVSQDFCADISGLRVFAEQIGPFADSHDAQLFWIFFHGLMGELGLTTLLCDLGIRPPPDITLSQGCPTTVGNVGNEDPQLTKEQKEQLSQTIKQSMRKRMNDDASFNDRLEEHLTKFAKAPPQSGQNLRKGTLLNAVSYLDALVARLIRLFYRRYRDAMPSDTMKLSLADLRDIGTIEAAEDYLLTRRIDALLRRGFNRQLAFFEKRLKIDLKSLDEFRPLVIETVQRRHLLVHNGGVVNRQYLDRVDSKLISEYSLKEGETISISEKYLKRAIDRIHLTGLILIQQCWRKWFKEEAANADSELNEHIYDCNVQRRYTLAQHIGEYAKALPISENATAMNIRLNLAQAYKWDGKLGEMKSAIDSKDWSGCGLVYRLAIHSLQDEADKFFDLLPLALAAKEVSSKDLLAWPIFQSMRQDKRFRAIVEPSMTASTTVT